jgi:hypothetical protein|tara:strand:- start:4736 stop:6805 length:2070 start_codon:yes stop_codon:yes gene_type:complete
MALVNLRTNLKDLRYGNDRRDGGSSGQPYVTTSIPNGEGPGFGDYDFLLRGGSLLPGAVVNDVSRLTQMMFDLKSPNGLLFSVKQNALSRSGVNIKAQGKSANIVGDPNRLALNNGIYLPTSTLAQAAVNPLGGHLLKQGINPFAETNTVTQGNTLSTGFGGALPLANPIYLDTLAQNERQQNQSTSRLIQFTNAFIKDGVRKPDNPGRYVVQEATELYSYSGGPGSTLGVGKTRISISKDRTGRNNPNLAGDKSTTNRFFSTSNKTQKPIPKPTFGTSDGLFGSSITTPTPAFNSFLSTAGALNYGREDYSVFTRPSTYYQAAKIFSKTLSTVYQSMGGVDLFDGKYTQVNNTSVLQDFSTNVFQPGTFKPQAPSVVSGLEDTLDYNQLMEAGNSGSVDNAILQDFRQRRTDNKGLPSLDYTRPENRIEGRVNLGDPGRKTIPRTSYVKGTGKALDKITALPLYRSKNVDTDKDINDLCKFRIGVIDNNDPSFKTYIHFRAFLDGMDDSYSADWASQKFSGRAENLYNYQGFDRSVNLSWTVAAQSKEELMPMYRKLNYLASVCAPSYSDDGYMRGNLIELTVGGYLFNQVGIMKGINYTVPMESPWEIGIKDTPSNALKTGGDPSVKELPMMIKVSGFQFIPIHNFVPSIQKNGYGGGDSDDTGDVTTYGDQRYIALSNKYSNNYEI